MGDRKRIFKKNQQGLLFQTLVPSARRHQGAGRQMCQKTGKRPQSHLILDYKTVVFQRREWGWRGGGDIPVTAKEEEPDTSKATKTGTV